MSKKLLKTLIKSIFLFEVQDDNEDNKFTDITPPRTKKEPSNAVKHLKQFNFEEFKQLKTSEERYKYAENTLKYSGSGSSRTVFYVNDKLAIKLPNPDNENAGLKQNQAELKKCQFENFFAKIYKDQSDPQGKWLIVDVAQPLSPEKFQELTKINWQAFTSALFAAFASYTNKGVASNQSKMDLETVKNIPFFQQLLQVVSVCKLMPGDLGKLSNWGVVSGKPVLVDYGFTEDSRNQMNLTRVINK